MQTLRKGDTIRCANPKDLINTMQEIERLGYSTDFMYEKDGEHGYWLVITKGVRHETRQA